MKKLSLLMFAILILGCDTETSVVDEPPPVIEEPPPVVMEAEPVGHPLIARGTVKHGEVNVDPEPLNRHGFHFELTQDFFRYWVWLYVKDGEYLNWDATLVRDRDRRDSVWIRRMDDYDLLEFDTEYKLVMSFQDVDCEFIDIVIEFRTKPQRSIVEETPTVMEERTPVVPSGEHFRLDIVDLAIVDGTVFHGEDNVDPEPLNANGIHFEFDEPIRKYEIDLRLDGGATLGWLPRGLVEPENPVGQIKIMPAEGFPLLEFDTIYEIDILVQDVICRTSEFKIVFRTKPKP